MTAPGMEKVISSTSINDLLVENQDRQRKVIPSRGSQAFGLTDFQYLLCSKATCHTVSVPASDAIIGGNSRGASPSNT